jgi:DNA-binding CsgD family transcriptional regulator
MKTALLPPEVERGRAAYARLAWGEAYEAFSAADAAAELTPEDLERLAWAAGITGRDQELLRVLERLHGVELQAGHSLRAARCAFWLGFRLFSLGEPARASGWIARGERLVEREGVECVEQGYLLLPAYFQRREAGDIEGAYAIAERVAQIGERFNDADLTAFGRQFAGQALLRQGNVKEGLRLLDEVMVVAIAGELSPQVTGLMFCAAIAACERFYALDRAREWIAALQIWCATQPDVVFNGACQIHRARLMQLGGDWVDAIAEARRASERPMLGDDADIHGGAAYEQAEILRLRGEFELSEAAYTNASKFGREPQPGLALLRLAQGRSDAAVSSIRRVLGAMKDKFERASLLPAHVEIVLAVGELEEARTSCDELDELSRKLEMDVVVAMSVQARGALLLAQGDAQAALAPLRQAFSTWQHVGAPYIAARIRVLLGRACRELGDEDGAALEFAAARSVFERLEAAPDLRALALLEKRPAAAKPHGLTARELEVLRLVAQGLTNKVIAKQLFLSEKTVDRHLSNIFAKVNVSSRAAATAYAYQHQLV